MPFPHKLVIGDRAFFQPAMVYSSDWCGRAGHRSSWEAVPLHVRFRRYDTGEHYYIQKAEQSFLLRFECFDLLASAPPQLHRCIGLPEVWFAWVEGNRTRVHGISDFRQLLEQIRGNRLLWWRAFESKEEAEVRPESKPADWQNWDPLPDSDTQKWLTSQRLRTRKPDSSLVDETQLTLQRSRCAYGRLSLSSTRIST